jgi:glycosyltransferase involved in cell wall biosynthesis
LIILGEGEERAKLEALAVELGVSDTVEMPGFARNPYEYMRNASALCLSSRYEGMPTVLLEALALGCPVIATDCAEGVRTALGGGAYGALTPVGDFDALAAALASHLADAEPLRRKAAAAARMIREGHSYEVAAESYLGVIRELGKERDTRGVGLVADAASRT